MTEADDLWRAVYISSGVLGGLVGLLLILIIVLFVMNSRLNLRFVKLQNDMVWAKGPGASQPPLFPRPMSTKGSVYGGTISPRY